MSTNEENRYDFVVVGSGIAGLVFAALMAKRGNSVLVLEAHEHPGGYGHTFQLGNSAKFNAQLHYVWNCGEGETVHKVLSRLGLEQEVTFERLDPDGFDHMHMPGYSLKIPSSSAELMRRLVRLFPQSQPAIEKFIATVGKVAVGLDVLSSRPSVPRVIRDGLDTVLAISFLRSSLQDVFDKYQLPKAAQTLLASQWPDFLLPPQELSFYAWVMLFTGYQRGAYYPTHHFEHVIDSLTATILDQGGEVRFRQEVTRFQREARRIRGVVARDLESGQCRQFEAGAVICNMDPQRAAKMIGLQHFRHTVRKRLAYDYSPSNFMIYCTVEGIDLADYGFGKWNVFHTGHEDLNEAFTDMYSNHDYSNPSFAITTPGFMTTDTSDRPAGQSIVEILTVADHSYFQTLLNTDKQAYRKKKREVINALLDAVEKHYIPNFRKHLAFSTGGTPTTNERFCFAPGGNSYGSNMTPENIGINRLGPKSSLDGLYFCNASSGFAGFAGTFWTGASLYQKLSGERIL
jgi:phytoene dehydrogenase-like protein